MILKYKSESILKCKILKSKSEFLVLKYKNAVVLEWVNSDMPSEARGVLFLWVSATGAEQSEAKGAYELVK